MENITLEIQLQGSFGNLHRERHVLLLPIDPDENLLIGEKPDFYPEGITRLIGGGVDPEETFEEAAIREINEEMGLNIVVKDLEKVAEIIVNARTPEQVFKLITCLFTFNVSGDIKPGDDIAGIKKISIQELYDLAEKYESFDQEDRIVRGDYSHSWRDYGLVYGPIHRVAADYLSTL